MSREQDAATLRAAVEVMRRRGRKPKSILFQALCGTLLDFAGRIERGEREPVKPAAEDSRL